MTRLHILCIYNTYIAEYSMSIITGIINNCSIGYLKCNLKIHRKTNIETK